MILLSSSPFVSVAAILVVVVLVGWLSSRQKRPRFSLSTEEKPVEFAVFAPGQMPRDSSHLVDLWVFKTTDLKWVRDKAAKIAQERLAGQNSDPSITEGTELLVSFSIPSFDITDQLAKLNWSSEATNASFPVKVPGDAHSGGHSGEISMTAKGTKVATVRFSVQVGEAINLAPKLSKVATETIITGNEAFASLLKSPS